MATKTFKIGLSNTDKQNMAQDVYERLLALTFPEYETTESYEFGDFVVYNDQLYKCIGATSGAWDSSKWQLATLNDLLTDIENAVAFVNDKANVDGNYPTMTVGMADNLTPYDESAGDDQDEPFSFQATGTGNGTQPDFATGSAALMKEKQGNTVVVNQKVQNPEFSTNSNWTSNASIVVIDTTNHKAVVTDDSTGNVYSIQQSLSSNLNNNDTILCIFTLKIITQTTSNQVRVRNPFVSSGFELSNKTYFIIGSASNVGTYELQVIKSESGATSDSVEISNAYCIDLTQWFNGDIPADLIAHPENFFRYYQGSLAYNTGTLANANGRYIKCIGMNQCDEVFEGGEISDGQNTAGADAFRTKNYIDVIPGTTYCLHANPSLSIGGYYFYEYDKDKNFIKGTAKYSNNSNFELSPNTFYVRFYFFKSSSGWGTNVPSKEDAQVSLNLYYEDEERCLTYEPYEVLTNNDTGTEVLRSAGSVKDYKTPDGVVHRLVGSVDLSTLSWTYRSYDSSYRVSLSSIGAISYSRNAISSKYILVDGSQTVIGGFYLDGSNLNVFANEGDTPTGLLFYELAEPTTEQGTPYSENLVIDDFGSMDFGGTNGVPQGALIFYPVDYKAFVDTLYKYTDGTPSDIALKSDLPTAPQTWAESLPGYDATKTQVLKNVEGTLTWVTEE